jgi:hypothetical protein
MNWRLVSINLEALAGPIEGPKSPIIRLHFKKDELGTADFGEEGQPLECYYEILLDREVPVRT